MQSKVATYLGKEGDKDKEKEQISQIDQIRNMMSVENRLEGQDKKGGGGPAPPITFFIIPESGIDFIAQEVGLTDLMLSEQAP